MLYVHCSWRNYSFRKRMLMACLQAFLDTPHLRWHYHPIHLGYARILCSSLTCEEGSQNEERDRQREYRSTIGSRKQIYELRDHDGHESTFQDVDSRIDCTFYLHVSQPGVRYLLSLLRGISDHLPRPELDLPLQCWRNRTGKFFNT